MHVPEKATADIKRLPAWVKCMFCGKPPTDTDWLGELVPDSNALAHQSCAKARGQVFGLNAGTIQEINGKIGAVQGE